ncbi:MAG: hypothetical protein IKR48_09410 [Kiritimatiellae bacterium]|nr:hypothetical protein [Kiritimatiellia bacterium]
MTSLKNIKLRKKKTIVFLFQSLMAASKNEILMGMAQYAQRQRNIVIRCIEEDDVDDKNAFAECDGIFTNTCNEKTINHMTAAGLPIARFHDKPKRLDMIDIGFCTCAPVTITSSESSNANRPPSIPSTLRGWRRYCCCWTKTYVKEVTTRTGFSSLQYFSHAYRDFYGHPPSQSRNTKQAACVV